ncbi:MAG TPA: hypothetical protein DCS29_04265 [Candidatus Magasanikbacteria bacterium]|nr:hypothetical protein [Candidatus Magasanikbacteria bacterium]
MKNFFTILVLILLLSPQVLLAADFDPNFIISDEEMQNYQSMTRSDIQAFLEEKGGYISNYHALDWEGTTRKASDIIYRAAQESKINPKYLLVKLQKEQSLVTAPDPTDKQLDWATGYGVCDSCSMSDPDIQKYKGFGIQVDRAAGIMRWYYEHMYAENWIKRANVTYTIDDTQVTPTSNATGFLYSYTPHLHGNENFWNLWQRWFDQIYPDGTLAKTTNDPSVYLIQGGKKRKFENMTSLLTRYNPNMIVTIPASELARYENIGTISLPNYAIVKEQGSYYLLDYDYKRPFASYDVVRQLGYNPDEVIDVTASDLNSYTFGSTITAEQSNPLGRVVRISETKELFYIQGNMYYPIYDEIIAKINFPNLTIEKAHFEDFDTLSLGDPILLKDGTLFGVKEHNKIYVVEKGKKRHIASEEIFEGLGYNWSNVVWLNQFAGMAHDTGTPMSIKPETSNTSDDTTLISTDSTANNTASEETDPKETNSTNPVDYMVKTSVTELSYVGPQFETNMETYLVADYSTQEILAGKNIDFERPMASLTKVMTGYQLLLDGINLNQSTTYDPNQHKASYHTYRIAAGERVLNQDLMYAMLVSSLNTPSRMLVNTNSNQEDAFIARMNNQAKNWGLSHTTFADTSGLDVKNVTTARDYLTIFSKASNDTTMHTYLGATSYTYTELTDLDGKPDHADTNSNYLMAKTGLPYTVIASKTGFLYEAGTCLAMRVKRNNDGKEFVIIAMGNPDFGKNTRFNEFEMLSNWAMQTL